MKLNIAATKTNLIKTKKALSLTQEGYQLLDEKRRILMAELTAIIDSVDQHQRQVDDALKQAYALLDKAIVAMGYKRIEEISFSIDIKSTLAISQRRVMGVSIPIIELGLKENPPYYSSCDINLHVDETIAKFKETLKILAVLAEKKIALIRLAEEAQKTIRKVNALEKVYIPEYRQTVKYISDRLDEEARDSFSMLKLIKKAKLRN